jgi:hypothetical protein
MQMTIPLKRWQVRQDSKNDFCGFRCVIRPIQKMFRLQSFFTLIKIPVQVINVNGVLHRMLGGCRTVAMRDFGKILIIACYKFAPARNLDNTELTSLVNLRFIVAGLRVLVDELQE